MIDSDRTSPPHAKQVLLVAYYFPPDNAVGGLRIAKFARYLPSFGWEPTVLTVKDRYREQVDRARLKDLNDVKVVKTMQLPRFTEFLLSIKRAVPTFLGKGKTIKKTTFESMYGDDFGSIQSETLSQRLKRYYFSLSSSPDSEHCWILPAALNAVRELRRGGIACVMTSSPPHSSHMIGLIAKKVTHVKWVADFRDPWIDMLHRRSPLMRSALSDWLEKWLETLVIHNADNIVTTTEEFREAIIARFPCEPSDKFLYIPNSIDSEKFSAVVFPERYDKFTLSYAGTIYLKRTPEPIFEAIQLLVSSGKIQPSEIRFKLFGNCDLIDGRPINSVIKAYGLESIVEVSKPIPFTDAINIMQRSHLLVLLAPSVQDINIPAKVYDYFGSGTKIMAITGSGSTLNLIEKTNSGICFEASDVNGIAELIYSFLKRRDRNDIRNDPTAYANFDARLLTEKLARQFSQLTEG